MDLILQPFGDLKAMEHVMLSFRFADGRHVVVSMEARQARGAEFDPLAGFFRRDPIYPELATERDLFWERLARTPPDEIQIYPIRQSPEVVRVYFERILRFTTQVHERPKFYSTLTESCMTSFINLAPERFASVPWYDLRRWIPGYALPLFQQLGLVDDTIPADALARADAATAAAQVCRSVVGSPAWKPQATFAEVTTSSSAASSPRRQAAGCSVVPFSARPQYPPRPSARSSSRTNPTAVPE